MATARIERNIDRHILNLVDAINVRATDGEAWGFYPLPTTSTFGDATTPTAFLSGHASAHASRHCLPHQPHAAGNPMPWLGDRARAERRAILQRSSIV